MLTIFGRILDETHITFLRLLGWSSKAANLPRFWDRLEFIIAKKNITFLKVCFFVAQIKTKHVFYLLLELS